jgi:ABC-2 type transport system ATP-binding protein
MIAELNAVTKRYGAGTALDRVTLRLEAGRVTAVLGPNGAGKTTAVKLLLGLTQPTSGRVALFGADPRWIEARRRTGVMLQIAELPVGSHRQARREESRRGGPPGAPERVAVGNGGGTRTVSHRAEG